jgi:hypothetical protein
LRSPSSNGRLAFRTSPFVVKTIVVNGISFTIEFKA